MNLNESNNKASSVSTTRNYMQHIETANQIMNTVNFLHNDNSPYSGYFIFDENKKQQKLLNRKDNFSFIDIEYQDNKTLSDIEFNEGSDSIFSKIREIVKSSKEKSFSVMDYDTILSKKYKQYLSFIYNSFPKILRKRAFVKNENGELTITEDGMKILSNVWKIVIQSYNHRSLDSLRETLGGTNNFDIIGEISKPGDMKYVFDLLDYLTLPGKDFGKKIIFLNRSIALLAFLGGIDVEQIQKDFAGLEEYFKSQNIRRDQSKVHIEYRFKDMYSAVQKLISQPDNNAFLSDLQGFRFTYDSKEDLKLGLEQQYISVIHYIDDINKKSGSNYKYKINSMNISNKGILTPDEESLVIDQINSNSLIKQTKEIKKRNKTSKKKAYDYNIIKDLTSQYDNESESVVQNLLQTAASMSTGSNGEYADIKPIIMINVIDQTTKEEKEIGIEIQNVLKNNRNNYYNRANHNFLESQKHTLSRARDKGYNTTQKIYKYITKAIISNSKDLIKLRNKVEKREVLETPERYEEQCFYTTEAGEKIDLRNITNNISEDNKDSIDLIVYDLLHAWLREGRICIDNNNDERKKLEKGLYNDQGELLHIAFRGHNLINNLETTRLQLNQSDNLNVKNTGRIIFYPFGSDRGQESLQAPTELLRRIVQKQLVLDHKQEKNSIEESSS